MDWGMLVEGIMRTRWKAKLRSDVIRAVLAEGNISQNALARMIPVSSGYMAQLMNGTRHPSHVVRRRLLYILGGCKFDDLFVEIEGRKE